MDLLGIDFNKVDPSKDSKENILVLTDAFTKFSQAFITPNQKALTIAKILVDKWFYVYGIPAWIHSDQGWCFKNKIMKHLYAMYGVEQSTTMPYTCVAMQLVKDLTVQWWICSNLYQKSRKIIGHCTYHL